MQLLLNTRDAENASNTNPKFNIHNLKLEHTRLRLLEAVIPNLRYTIHSGNKTFVFQENDTATNSVATLTEGNYSATSLGTEIKTQLDAAGANTYTVSYDTSTMKYSIISSSDNHKIMSSSTCLYELGYTEMTSFSLTSSSTYPVRLDGTTYVDVVCYHVNGGNITSDNRQSVLMRIPMEVENGAVVYYHNRNPHFSEPVMMNDLKHLELALRDDKNNEYVLPSSGYCSFLIDLE